MRNYTGYHVIECAWPGCQERYGVFCSGEAILAAGWVALDDEHYCPEHGPRRLEHVRGVTEHVHDGDHAGGGPVG